jgi:phage virion morphogenesis protein
MADTFNVRIAGADKTIAELSAIAARLKNPQPMYDEIGSYLVVKTQNRFDTGTAPGGSKWPASLRAKNFGGKTLVDSARLYQSITHNASANGVEVGSNVEYAAIHQFGGTIYAKTEKGLNWRYNKSGANKPSWARKMSVTIPARPFLGIDAEDQTEIIVIAESYIAGGIHAHQ